MLSQEAIEKILGLEINTTIEPADMCKKMIVTFYPHDSRNATISTRMLDFEKRLHSTFSELGVKVLPYEDTLVELPFFYRIKKSFQILLNNLNVFFKKTLNIPDGKDFIHFAAIKSILRRRKIKKGVTIIALGENKTGHLPKDYTQSFTENMVITIVDIPQSINEETDFHTHFDVAMELFSHHMANIVIGLTEDKWVLYNFNASHPLYPLNGDLKKPLLYGLIPKVVAPIKPNKYREFIIKSESFDADSENYKEYIDDFISAGAILEKVGIYPPGKSIDGLSWRNDFYRWIGKLHLDHRSGMSYGFLAWQLPSVIPELKPISELTAEQRRILPPDKDYFIFNSRINIIVEIRNNKYYLEIPDVWVLSQRSGSNKTKLNPKKDLIKLGLSKGKMYMETPFGLKLNPSYKPSFDTRVMLANAIGNVVIAAIMKQENIADKSFLSDFENRGIAMIHWHGYLDPQKIPFGWHIHGTENPHVSCSSPQSAIYALDGKLRSFQLALQKNEDFLGDVHIEPHHGTNITFSSLMKFADLLAKNSQMTRLGNFYLQKYKSEAHSINK